MRRNYVLVLGIALVIGAFLFQNVSAGPPVTGAIFTTLEDGTRVNANIYEDKRDVYLDGGPGPNAPQDAAGLPDGNYYFQVTDPSGKKLLSEDPAWCREFVVEDGVISEYLGIGRTYEKGNGKKTKTVDCYQDGWQHGMHDLGFDVDHDALTIQLMPYDDTPNKGGVYKVWATPVEEFVGDPMAMGSNYQPGNYHGFIPRYSKTDNFKAKVKGKPVTPEIEICKFEDVNGNGIWDAGEPAIPGWMIDITDPLDVTNTYYTGADGCIVIYAPVNGEYVIVENLPPGWGVTATIVDGVSVSPATHTVTIDVDYKKQTKYSVAFGNFECFCVSGYKYEDMNADGNWDPGDTGIQDWTVTLYRMGGSGWEIYDQTTTDSNGYYSFEVCEGGQYKVEEEQKIGWTPSSPTSFTFDGLSGVSRMNDFFNFHCFSVSGNKYEDVNGDGDWDAGEPGIGGWTITLYQSTDGGATWTEFASTKTDGTGYYEFCVCEYGLYKVVEEDRTGWIATSPTEITFEGTSGNSQTFDFFNFELGQICGKKWYDLDKDGVKDSSEQYIEGFKIELWKDGSLFATVFTGSDGRYCFYDLGPGDYEVKEVMPNNPGDYLIWAQTYPSSGTWTYYPLESGTTVCNAHFGNIVEFTGGLTWGYWKTHTGSGSPPQDPAYLELPDDPMPVDLPMPGNDYSVDNADDADWVFDNAGDPPVSCSGDCRSLFRAQLLALHMNLIKFEDMGGMLYFYPSDDHDGDTVDDIYNAALTLLNDGSDHDFTDFQETLDRINNNGHYDPGDHVLVMPVPPVPNY
jgi:hypothetical protein